MNAQTLETTIRTYYYDTSKPAEAEQYARLVARLLKGGRRCFATLSECGAGKGYRYTWVPKRGKTIELETACIFDNQWNTAPIPKVSAQGHRVFDWAEDVFPNRDIKSGHYRKQTDAMKAIRKSTLKCGWCGHHYPGGHTAIWCTACLDGPDLEEKLLPLLVLMPAGASHNDTRPVLSADDLAVLVADYVQAQTVGKHSRAVAHKARQRRDVLAKAKRTIACATMERDGKIWLLDHDVSLDNVIFYDHTQRFSFGWRTPLSADVETALVEALKPLDAPEFPFPYDIQSV